MKAEALNAPFQGSFDDLFLPSKLREKGGRHDFMRGRLGIVRTCVEQAGLAVPLRYREDEHFWFTVMRNYRVTSSTLRRRMPGSNFKTTSLELAVENAGRILAVEQDAALDPLTGAWSRGSLDRFLSNVLNTATRRMSTAGVLMIDVDYFKKYNDQEGHKAGDQILIDMVRILQGSVRGNDMVARYGGEEFTIVLPVLTAPRLASVRAEEFRRRIAEMTRVTVSIGVTTVSKQDEDVESVLVRADGNLYRAKEGGRNVVFDDRGRVTARDKKIIPKQAWLRLASEAAAGIPGIIPV
ncbi:GGDEF domain-containing protein [Candidatus Daviesbacteria bacterium]|nr:GGDEF domain-containing protein [Candidatus Daviesbacteria bacterium]